MIGRSNKTALVVKAESGGGGGGGGAYSKGVREALAGPWQREGEIKGGIKGGGLLKVGEGRVQRQHNLRRLDSGNSMH